MAQERRLHVYWDAELDGQFRRRFERALAGLQVEFADASAVDIDPDGAAPVKLAVVSATGQSTPRDTDLVLLAGPGEFRESAGGLRLEAVDIDNRARRWIAFAEKLGLKLDRPALARFAASGDSLDEQRAASLAFPSDPLSKDFAPNHSPEVLMEKLAAMTARAEAAERAAADLERERSDAIRDRKQADAETAAERARNANLEQSVERLTALSESSVFALSYVSEALRPLVESARDHAWRARLAAAQASEAAQQHPDALAWPKAHASYSGETRNRLPHGHGVMVFREGAREVATYAGNFEDGRRSGHGVATSDGGHRWSGQWNEGEASGLGLLEAPGGTRFEGEVAQDDSGSPRQVRGWTWSERTAQLAAHRPVAPALPPPVSRIAGG
jgi:hypothetical protein